MKQAVLSLKDGTISWVDAPAPNPGPHQLLIRTQASVLSSGTERMLVDFGRSSLLSKAMQQPERVRQVVDKIQTDGLGATVRAVKEKLDEPLALGYCNAGVVVEVGEKVHGFMPGDRVVSNGGHAEFVLAAKNLCVRIPEVEIPISSEEAALTPLAAVALQGLRLAEPQLGETFVVIGFGLVGLITAQLLRINGCRVLGLDPDARRAAMARQFGVETLNSDADAVAQVRELTHGRGADGVLITAATRSSEPVHQSAEMSRKRGRIVLVGLAGLELSRADFYEKELRFQVSCSYGPGRYDARYEQEGADYPSAFVPWTAGRNFAAIVDLLASGKLDFKPLLTRQFPFASADKAWQALDDSETLAVVLDYPEFEHVGADRGKMIHFAPRAAKNERIRTSVIGAGNYGMRVLLPILRRERVSLASIASSRGLSAARAAKRFGAESATSDVQAVLGDPNTDVVFVLTRHDTHADLTTQILEAGKHVFVEKPLALNIDELERVIATYEKAAKSAAPPLLCVGFNRRFAPLVERAKEALRETHEPLRMVFTVNAGALPDDHWTRDQQVGGGRIIGEACHFIDLARYFAGAEITQVANLGGAIDEGTLQLAFADGSRAVIHYFTNGHRRFPKERIEIFTGGRVLVIDNMRELKGFGFRKKISIKGKANEKGHRELVQAFFQAIRNGQSSPIPFTEIVEVMRAGLRAAQPTLWPSND